MLRLVKRAMDVGLSVGGLTLAGPAIALLAMAVRLDSPGWPFFGHERVGMGGRRFRVWKLRTMTVGAEANGLAITAGGDRRVTRLGAFLRRWKLDELPQLANVLLGDMSLVGPRPEAPKYVDLFASDYERILRVRPGLTDEASLRFRNEEALLSRSADPERMYVEEVLPAKLRLAHEYVGSMSLCGDVSILARTAWAVVSGKEGKEGTVVNGDTMHG